MQNPGEPHPPGTQNYCVDMYVYSKGILFVPDCN